MNRRIVLALLGGLVLPLTSIATSSFADEDWRENVRDPGMMGGYGPGMMGGYGPGMMGGYGPGMMGGYGSFPRDDDTPALFGRLGWLGLSDEQRERILEIQGEHLDTSAELWTELQGRLSALEEALGAERPDVDVVGQRHSELSDVRRRLLEARVSRDVAVREQLDEKQRSLLERW